MYKSSVQRMRNMRRWPFLVPLLFLLTAVFSVPAFADKRIALVVGNSAYRNVASLDNPANDAKLLADTLTSLGFTLVGGGAQLDLDKSSLDRAVQAFGSQLVGADVGLFYYAGHGVQVRGENYLIPVDANPTKEADIDFQMLDTNLVLRQMEGAGTRLNIVILDACRNNPFGGRGLAVGRAQDAQNSRLRDTTAGLAQMQAPEGTLISFATQPGSVAQDGANGNSPYARALALTMRRPNLDIFQTFNQVGLAVKRATGGVQQPWVSSSPIDGTFYFVAPSGADTPAAAALIPAPQTALLEMPKAPAAPQIDPYEVARSLQLELKRVGCFDGAVDGEFNAATRAALQKFSKLAVIRVPNDDPSLEVLRAVRGVDKRICPLLCQSGERAEGDRCARILPSDSPKAAAHPTNAKRAISLDPAHGSSGQEPKTPGPVAGGTASGSSGQGHTTCGRNGCQVVPPGCRTTGGGGGHGLGGKIVCGTVSSPGG
jgi:Caspase domain